MTVACVLQAAAQNDLSKQAQPSTTLPNGRQITPVGDWTEIAPFPFSLTLRPDGKELVAASLGFPFALNILDDPSGIHQRLTQIPQGYLSKPEVELYTGVAFSQDGKLLYVSTGDSGAVDMLSTSDWQLFVHGARAVITRIKRDEHSFGEWLNRIEARSPKNVAIVAMANKLARIAWAVLTSGEVYSATVCS